MQVPSTPAAVSTHTKVVAVAGMQMEISHMHLTSSGPPEKCTGARPHTHQDACSHMLALHVVWLNCSSALLVLMDSHGVREGRRRSTAAPAAAG